MPAPEAEPSFFPLAALAARKADLAALRRRFAEHGYGERAARERLGIADVCHLSPERAAVWDRFVLRRGPPLDALIRLFLLGLPEAEAHVPFSAEERGLLLAANLIEAANAGAVRARVALFPVEDRLVATDFASSPAPNRVMALGADSYGLARLVPRPARADANRALDLCTGSGVVALEAARLYGEVRGLDVSPRAVNFARFNALLNGVANCTFEVSDVYEAVRGERFDLVTANPPFVPSDGVEVLFRDGGRGGEDVLARVVEGARAHLAPGGVCAIVADLVEHAGRPYEEKLRGWLGPDAAADGLVLRAPGTGPLDYAMRHHCPPALERVIEALLADGVLAVSPGHLAIARRAAPATAPRVASAPISSLLGPGERAPDLLPAILRRLAALGPAGVAPIPLRSAVTEAGAVLASASPFFKRFPVSQDLREILGRLGPGRAPATVLTELAVEGVSLSRETEAEILRTLEWMYLLGLLDGAA